MTDLAAIARSGPASTAVDLAGLTVEALAALVVELGGKPFQGRQLFRWIHRRGVIDLDAMTDLPKDLRARLAEQAVVRTPEVVRRDVSSDGTTKLLLRLDDGREIEAVFIPDTPSQTFCISTQVGCAMKCVFCLTGTMGLARHLSASEIAGQIRVLARELGFLDRPFNVVLMGMGEPLHNYDATMAALRLIGSADGLHVSPRRVTLSTVGLVPGLDRLAGEDYMPNLAISLHATTEAQRDALVPINRKYSLSDLMAACRRFPLKKRSRITFEYVLLDGVNDTAEDARRLVRLMNGLRAKVNLLPLNAATGIPFGRPADQRVDAFAQILANAHITVSVRKSRGRDIRAACGQLVVDNNN
ncbi:MAG: 23S rRNA (adenine(2503)-C(2))-methyltransferase RlmN [Luteitalea sp.]|nr:23S rRNA (adenine(2503)-C(2))-methyltransferase RlmN [Acidobacteriota bacterium]